MATVPKITVSGMHNKPGKIMSTRPGYTYACLYFFLFVLAKPGKLNRRG
ncbi:hypothetical protein ADICYQ_3277 [Cyclobacterium qasimii M12-11B]|uniref:Uncharacterized protein n=1 Tax=Cyclobacterium qasimii M12-11B TaxID=641524 RepID=S7VDK4_9BACT|nr:hypothetical protein ADICYQ_3277 [Cyclobacterium qasimii M12-11B]